MNNVQETSKHLVKLKKKLKKAKGELTDLKEEINNLHTERDKVYKSVQCMTVDYVTTTDAMKRMRRISGEIKGAESRIKLREKNVKNCLEDIDRQEAYLTKIK